MSCDICGSLVLKVCFLFCSEASSGHQQGCPTHRGSINNTNCGSCAYRMNAFTVINVNPCSPTHVSYERHNRVNSSFLFKIKLLFIRRDVTQTFHASLALIGASISRSWRRLWFVVGKWSVPQTQDFIIWPLCTHQRLRFLGDPFAEVISVIISRGSRVSICQSWFPVSPQTAGCVRLCATAVPPGCLSLCLDEWRVCQMWFRHPCTHTMMETIWCLLSAQASLVPRFSLFICKILGFLFVSVTPLFYSLTLFLLPYFPIFHHILSSPCLCNQVFTHKCAVSQISMK